MSFPTIAPDPFFNRTAELAALDRAWRQRGSGGQMTLLYGRRRLGKTYLLQRFFAGSAAEPSKPHCYYLAEQTTAAAHRNALAAQLLDALPGNFPTRSGSMPSGSLHFSPTTWAGMCSRRSVSSGCNAMPGSGWG